MGAMFASQNIVRNEMWYMFKGEADKKLNNRAESQTNGS